MAAINVTKSSLLTSHIFPNGTLATSVQESLEEVKLCWLDRLQAAKVLYYWSTLLGYNITTKFSKTVL